MSHLQQQALISVHPNDWQAHSPLFTNTNVRGFVSESGVVFKFVQRVSRDQEPLSLPELLKSSRKYRSVIHSWFIKLNAEQTEELSADETSELEELSKTLKKLEIAWHLCEILFIDIRSPGSFLVQLFHWIKWHFTQYVEMAEQVIVDEIPQMHEYYWDVIFFFTLRGEMENAALFLELHSESNSDPAFILLRDLLKKFPQLSANQVYHEYYIRWELWHESVQQAISEGRIELSHKKSHIQLNLLLELLSGNLEAFQSVSHLFTSWYQMMISYLLFSDPCLKKLKLESLSDQFINIFYSLNGNDALEVDSFDELIRSAFSYNLMDVINRASLCFNDNWWFVTHFTDLIYNSGQFKDYQIADLAQIRNAFVTDFADTLASRKKQFWQLAIEYLINCKNSEDHILLILEHIPFESDKQMQTLVTQAKRFKFVELELSLYKIQARKWLEVAKANQKQKFGAALFWAIRSKDKMLINNIVEQYLQHYLKTAAEQVAKTEKMTADGELLDEDMVANIGSSIILSDRLIFLGKYYEFHQLKNAAQFEAAAKILVDMLDSNAIPEFFTFQVILDCLPLLEAPNVVIGSEQTCKILASLEQIIEKFKSEREDKRGPSVWSDVIPKANADKKKDEEMETLRAFQRNILSKYENMLRLAITRNLSRNFVLPSIARMTLQS